MKKYAFILLFCIANQLIAQEHFGGINFSSRTGILNGIQNPAELTNLSSNFEVQLFATSFGLSNNKITIEDFFKQDNIENLIFEGSDPVNLRFDAELLGPGVAFHFKKWVFGINTRAFAKFNLIDIDTRIGDAIANTGLNSLPGSTAVLMSDKNQRLNGTSWGEVGFSAARQIFESENSILSVGATFKLLFPGSYANFGLDNLTGTITNAGTTSYLNNVDNASLNIEYSGNLGEDFTSNEDYYKSMYGNLNGFGFDFGLNYRYKNSDDTNDRNYLVNAGFAMRNFGSMTFKDDNNTSTNYNLNIESTVQNPFGIDLLEFENVTSLNEIEQILTESGYLTGTKNNSDFKVNLPTTINLYADIKVIHSLFVTLYTQQKLKNEGDNSQITTQNIISVTPRLSRENFEIYSTWASNEISGLTGGLGARIGGFFMGSSSVVTMFTNGSNQADLYIGWRIGFGQ
uniref:hypothetical protein n=1 Tax=Flavobacterium sp. TaxID=239 RepID=UPI00404A4F50